MAAPGLHELRFHVEHGPIDPPATPVASLLDQPMDARLDHLHGKNLQQLGQGGGAPAADTSGRALARDLDPEGQLGACRGRDLSNDSQVILFVTYKALTVSCAERSAATEDEDRIQKRGFSRAICAPDQGQAWGNPK